MAKFNLVESKREINLFWEENEFHRIKDQLEKEQDFKFNRSYEKFNKLKTISVIFNECQHNGTFIIEDLIHLENVPVIDGKVCCVSCAKKEGYEGSYSVKKRMADSEIDFSEARKDRTKPAGIGSGGFIKDVMMKERPAITQEITLELGFFTLNVTNETYYKLLFGEYAGVYRIRNNATGTVYIGSSNNLYERLTTHARKLTSNSHDNKEMQDAVNEYGLEAFTFSIIEITPRGYQKHAERKYIELYKSLNQPLYNVLTETMSSKERKEFKYLKYTAI